MSLFIRQNGDVKNLYEAFTWPSILVQSTGVKQCSKESLAFPLEVHSLFVNSNDENNGISKSLNLARDHFERIRLHQEHYISSGIVQTCFSTLAGQIGVDLPETAFSGDLIGELTDQVQLYLDFLNQHFPK